MNERKEIAYRGLKLRKASDGDGRSIEGVAVPFGDIYNDPWDGAELRKYTRSVPVRKEKAENAKTLGEVLKQHRLNCKMTQEFVAETLGVSRQAVSKWESGASAPSTTNLMALAKVFDVSAEELLKETQKN